MSGLRLLNTGTFFKDKQGMDSTSALLLFLTWFPATYVLVVNQSENLYYAYLTAFTALAANKQWASRASITSDDVLETTSDSVAISERVVTRTPPSKPKVRKR